MKKVLKVLLLATAVLVVLVAVGIAWLANAGKDRSSPPRIKIPATSTPKIVLDDPAVFSPARWDPVEREEVFAANLKFGSSDVLATSREGVVSATLSPPAVHSGLKVLEAGGTAMDAAVATSLAQVALATGAWVSYAGIINLVYYEAESGEVYNLNGSYNTVLGETSPRSIPTPTDAEGNSTPSGRSALVPGFFAGIEAAHERFGRMPLASLFEPAIYIAEEGFEITAIHGQQLERRQDVLSRLPETRAIFTKDDGSFYGTGDVIRQPELAKTLRAIAEQGSDYVYRGPWGEKFVAAVQADGGKLTMEDLDRYEVVWQEPLELSYGDFEVYVHGRPAVGGVNLVETFNLVKASDLPSLGDYRESPEAFFWYSQFTNNFLIDYIPSILSPILFSGLDVSDETRTSEAHAEKLWQAMSEGDFQYAVSPSAAPKHSDAVVVIDGDGNMVALTHTINTDWYGGTGIFVDGISIPDSAAIQQALFDGLEPGDRFPDPTQPVLILKNGEPFGALSSIGAGLHQKTFSVLYNLMENGSSLAEAMAAPSTAMIRVEEGLAALTSPPILQVVEREFPQATLDGARAMGLAIEVFEDTVETRGPLGYVVAAVVTEAGTYEAVSTRRLNAPAKGLPLGSASPESPE